MKRLIDTKTKPLTGKRYRTLTVDMEKDAEYGECLHPIGAEFIVGETIDRTDDGYAVKWQGTAIQVSTGADVPALGMWTIWTRKEIETEAVAL